MSSQIDPTLAPLTSGPHIGKLSVEDLRTQLGHARDESNVHEERIDDVIQSVDALAQSTEAALAQKMPANSQFASTAQGQKADLAVRLENNELKKPNGDKLDIRPSAASDLSSPARKRSFKALYTVPIINSNSQTGHTVRYGEGNRQRLIIRNPVGSPGNILVGYQPDPQNITQPNNPATFTTLIPGKEIVDFFSAGQVRVRSDQATGSVPVGLIAEIEVETTV